MEPFVNQSQKMSSWPRLPLELLIKVLKQIDRCDIIQCQLVCRSWIRATQVALYRDSVITTIEQATGFLSTVVSSPSFPGKHVQSLTLSSDLFTESSVWDPLNVFTGLAEHCPNLEILKLDQTFKPFWVRLLHERNSGNWTLLKIIPVPKEESEIEYYVYAALALKGTLEKLLVCDSLSSNVIHSPHDLEFRTLAKQLKDFKCLTSLDIKHHTEKMLIEMDALIEDCQSLKELNVALYPTQNQPVNSESETVTDEELGQINPRPEITKLTVTTPIKSENSFKYIMRKFPSLSYFSFNETTTKKTQKLMKANRFRMSKEVIDQLVEYVSKVSTSYTTSFLFIENTSEFVGSLIKSDVIRLRRLAISYDIDDMNDDELDDNPRMKLEKKLNDVAPTVIVIYRANCVSPSLPHMRLLIEVGAKLEILLIDLSKKENHMVQIVQPQGIIGDYLWGYYIDQALNTCKNLKALKILGGTLLGCDPDRAINESVKEVEILNCKLQAQVLTELSVRMPNMNLLVLKNCDYLTSGAQVIMSRNYFLIDMPYASLKILKWIGPENHATITADYFLLKVSTSLGERYYKAGERLEHCTPYDYNHVLRKKDFLKFHIRCESINSFIVKYAGFDRMYMIR